MVLRLIDISIFYGFEVTTRISEVVTTTAFIGGVRGISCATLAVAWQWALVELGKPTDRDGEKPTFDESGNVP
jgi:hypothetical protein